MTRLGVLYYEAVVSSAGQVLRPKVRMRNGFVSRECDLVHLEGGQFEDPRKES